jgi:microcystin-dependent protein
MVEYKKPLGPGTSATDGLYTYCHIVDVDPINKIAHVIDQLGNPRQVSITRSMGKQLNYPAIGEDWIITRQYGDWIFAVNVNAPPRSLHEVPAGGTTNSVLAKNSGTDYDVQWLISATAATPNSIARRDANGNTQAATPVVGADVAPKSYVDGQVSAVPGVPTGVLYPYAGSSAPSGYLLCNGTAISRTTYSALFSIIGTTYGVGDGLTTFNLPNMLGRIPVGIDAGQTEFNAAGVTGGEKTHILTVTEMPSHTHTQSPHNHTQAAHTHNIKSNSGSGATWPGMPPSGPTFVGNSGILDSQTPFINSTTATNNNTGGDGAHNNLQPYLALNYIIKT